jgi:hypothetical protein
MTTASASYTAIRTVPPIAGRRKRRRGAGSGTPRTCMGTSGPGERRCQRGREVRGVLQRRALPLTLTLAGDGTGLP